MSPPNPQPATPRSASRAAPGIFARYLGVFRYSGRALELVWSTSHPLTLALATLTLIAGVLPAGMAYAGKLIVDAVVQAAKTGGASDRWAAVEYVGLEAVIVMLLAAAQQGLSVCQSLLRAQLGQRVNVLILEKTLELDLLHFEDSEFYDKLTRARREASSRPLSLVRRTFGLVQNGISLLTYGGLLWGFSGWAVIILVVAGLPAFIVETRFGCFVGAFRRPASRPTSRWSWPVRTSPKRSSCWSLAPCCWSATDRFSTGCTARTGV